MPDNYVLVINAHMKQGSLAASLDAGRTLQRRSKTSSKASRRHRNYSIALTEEVKKLSGREPAEVEVAVPAIMAALKKQDRIARYIGTFLTPQVDKVFGEQGGKPFPKPVMPAVK